MKIKILLKYLLFTVYVNFHLKYFISAHSLFNKKILFYPEIPSIPYIVYKICYLLNLSITNNIDDKNIYSAIFWQDRTYKATCNELERFSKTTKVFNINCTDISKKKVDEVFYKVFGYSTLIDPTIFRGKCIKKSNFNAMHDGRVIKCPVLKKDKNYIYQIMINNQCNKSSIMDIRVPILGKYIPFLYLKFRSITRRFSNKNDYVKIANVYDVFTKKELEKIHIFCNTFGLDYGEIDILKDIKNKKIYITDVNDTPHGLPNHLLKSDKDVALVKLSCAFDLMIKKDRLKQENK